MYAAPGHPSRFVRCAPPCSPTSTLTPTGDIDTGERDTLILPSANGECMQVFLNEVSTRHPFDRIVMILDGAGWHSSQALKVPENIKLLPLPPDAPELNPVEHLRASCARSTFITSPSIVSTH